MLNVATKFSLGIARGRSLKYANLLNVLLLVATATGFAFYWPLQRQLAAIKEDERRLRDEYSIYELSDKELKLYHFQFKPATESIHPALDAKFVKSYRWSIRVPEQGFEFSDRSSGGGGDFNHIDFSIVFVIRPESLAVFDSWGHSGGGGEISSDQKLNEFLIANWHRLDAEICAEDEPVSSHLKTPRTLLKLSFSQDLLVELESVAPESAEEYSDRPFYYVAIKDPNRPAEEAEAIDEEDGNE